MEAVTGQVELKSKDTSAIERFVKDHLPLLEDHGIAIRRTGNGCYVAEFYSTKEPTT
jgi:hypothetical protein